ncbi:MAG: hypothetical protein AB1736_12535 [Chloroflexota bacterium]
MVTLLDGEAPTRRLIARFALGLLASGAVTLAGCQAVEPPVTTSPSDESEGGGRAIVAALVDFAVAPGAETFEAVDLAGEVWLGLADRLVALRPAAELVNAGAWLVDPGAAGFRERAGPFSALDLLAAGHEIVVSTDAHANCFGEQVPPPGQLADLGRISITPVRDSVGLCMNWWSVDLYVTNAAEIAAVTLDLGDP